MGRKKTFRDVAVYYRDSNKVWRKIPSVKVALEYDNPITIYGINPSNRNEQIFVSKE